ncbi:CDP-alcohol phosphatidyltransferase family protein [Candidatus Tisiphia endosymbiont of Nedyus quadrimaculatus]|uniref:CDP-alcohol phosphatidyltransferase family protein n=1 Tax=Candidatus Tisiphia endosymbiont of Nedyus quadrimaculatus TaxID=3139332 RepID=UPI00345E1B0E
MLKIHKVKITKPIPFIKLLPNFITLLGLVVGVSAIKFGLDGRWEKAVYCTLVAAIIDGIDGRIARMLNATSPFGAELDSLCDFANFGVVPAYLVYLWSFQQYEYKVLSWGSILLFMVCMALRLARFNTTIFHEIHNKKIEYFFTGVPAPCGALLALMPMILDFEVSSVFGINIREHTIMIDLYIVVIAFLLASSLPTFSTKNINIKHEYLSLAMMVFAVIIISLIIYPWYLLPSIAFIYMLSIPVCYFISKKFY